MSRRIRAGLAACVLAVCVFAVTAPASSTASAASYTTTGHAKDGAPVAGQCYLVRTAAVYRTHATGRDPIPCTKRHNLWVLGVRTVPAGVDLAGVRSAGEPRLWAFATRQCHRTWTRALGRLDRRLGLSSYSLQVLLPTPAQVRHGARWVSCDLAIAAPGGLLANRIHSPKRLSATSGRLLRLCGTAAYTMTTCARRHAYRSTSHATVIRARSRAAATNKTYRFCHRHQPGYRMYEWREVLARPKGISTYVVTCLGAAPRFTTRG